MGIVVGLSLIVIVTAIMGLAMFKAPMACPKCKRVMVDTYIDGILYCLCKDCGYSEKL